jgi:hypothetical protein
LMSNGIKLVFLQNKNKTILQTTYKLGVTYYGEHFQWHFSHLSKLIVINKAILCSFLNT